MLLETARPEAADAPAELRVDDAVDEGRRVLRLDLVRHHQAALSGLEAIERLRLDGRGIEEPAPALGQVEQRRRALEKGRVVQVAGGQSAGDRRRGLGRRPKGAEGAPDGGGPSATGLVVSRGPGRSPEGPPRPLGRDGDPGQRALLSKGNQLPLDLLLRPRVGGALEDAGDVAHGGPHERVGPERALEEEPQAPRPRPVDGGHPGLDRSGRRRGRPRPRARGHDADLPEPVERAPDRRARGLRGEDRLRGPEGLSRAGRGQGGEGGGGGHRPRGSAPEAPDEHAERVGSVGAREHLERVGQLGGGNGREGGVDERRRRLVADQGLEGGD